MASGEMPPGGLLSHARHGRKVLPRTTWSATARRSWAASVGVGSGCVPEPWRPISRRFTPRSTGPHGSAIGGAKPLLEFNPLRGVRLPVEKNPKRPVESYDRYLKLMEVAEKVDPRLPLALTLAESTGRRIGAIVKLRRDDLDLGPAPVWLASVPGRTRQDGPRAVGAAHPGRQPSCSGSEGGSLQGTGCFPGSAIPRSRSASRR